MNFKGKYHGDRGRSIKYVSRELEAKKRLLNAFGRYYDVVENGFATTQVGMTEGGSASELDRFDFAIASRYTKQPFCYVEVTGDNEDSEYAYILSEKVAKAERVNIPVYFVYEKRGKWRVFSVKMIRKYCELVKWLEDERPYYRVPFSRGLLFRSWASFVKSELVTYVARMRKHG